MPDPLQPSHSLDPTNAIGQEIQGNRNQAIGQIYGGIVVYVSGGQAIINPSAAESLPPGDSPAAAIGPNPYKGLLAFHEADSANFFGRSQDIQNLWERFRDLQNADVRLLPVYGPSGSGKSSLVRAGLIPKLGKHPLPGRDRARVAVLVPSEHPLEALATILARVATDDPTPAEKAAEFERVLRQVSEGGAYEGLRRIASMLPEIATLPLIVVVDQFEEVYSLCKGTSERDAFIANLLHAASASSCYVSVMLTLRSDFLGETQQHPVLNRLFSSQGFLVPTMGEENLREAITQPAEQARHPLDLATVNLLIEQTEGREGALPLLQFALTRIWEGLKQGILPAVTLEQIGGVGGALAGEAQRIYESLSEAEQPIARRVFLGLVQLGEGAKDTRRRVEIGDFVSQQSSSDQVKQVIFRFADPGARLITLASNGTSETAEVTHEALFDHWQALGQWLDSGRSDLRFQRRLAEAAKVWDGNGRPEGNLWRSPDLELLQRYHERASDDMTPLQLEFFAASQEEAANRKRQEQQQQRFQKWAIRGLVVLLVGAISSAGVAVYQLQQAQRKRVDQLAATAQALLATQPLEAEINAIAAIGLSQSAVVQFPDQPRFAAVEGSLLDAIRSHPERNRLSHEAGVVAIAFSPDGKTVVSGSFDGTLRRWDAQTGIAKGKPLTGHSEAVTFFAFSPDGKTIVSGSWDKTVRLWDAQTGVAKGKPLIGHQGSVNSVAFSPDGKTIVSGSFDKTLRRWDAQTGVTKGKPLTGHTKPVSSVAFSPDGKTIVSSSGDKTLRRWDAQTGVAKGKPLTGHSEAVTSFAFSPDGKTIVSGSWDDTLRLWDAQTGVAKGKPLTAPQDTVISVTFRPVNSVAFSPDGKTIVSGSGDETVRLWDVQTRVAKGKFTGHQDMVYSVAFSPDGKTIVSGSLDGTLRMWDAQTRVDKGKPLTGHQDAVSSVAFSPDGKTVVSGSFDGVLRRWDTQTGVTKGKPLTGHSGAISSVAFSPDGKTIVSVDETLRLWDAQTGVTKGNLLTRYTDSVTFFTFSPDGKTIVSGSGDNKTLRLWDAQTGVAKGNPLIGHQDSVNSVAFSPDGKTLVSGSFDYTLRLWDTQTGVAKGKPLTGHTEPVNSVAFSPDGQTIVSGSWDKTVRRWDAPTGVAKGKPLTGHTDRVYSVAFSPDGQTIVSGSGDNTLRLWDAQTGVAKGKPLTGHTEGVYSIAFAPDGKTVVSGSFDKTLRLWDVLPESWLRIACEQLQYHPMLRQPQTQVAREAKQTCEQYVWQSRR
jgi:WD40 repeat protein